MRLCDLQVHVGPANKVEDCVEIGAYRFHHRLRSSERRLHPYTLELPKVVANGGASKSHEFLTTRMPEKRGGVPYISSSSRCLGPFNRLHGRPRRRMARLLHIAWQLAGARAPRTAHALASSNSGKYRLVHSKAANWWEVGRGRISRPTTRCNRSCPGSPGKNEAMERVERPLMCVS